MYYFVTIQTANQETTQVILAYQTFDEAYRAFHYELQYRGGNREKTVCLILDENGQTIRYEVWFREQE